MSVWSELRRMVVSQLGQVESARLDEEGRRLPSLPDLETRNWSNPGLGSIAAGSAQERSNMQWVECAGMDG